MSIKVKLPTAPSQDITENINKVKLPQLTQLPVSMPGAEDSNRELSSMDTRIWKPSLLPWNKALSIQLKLEAWLKILPSSPNKRISLVLKDLLTPSTPDSKLKSISPQNERIHVFETDKRLKICNLFLQNLSEDLLNFRLI